MKIHPRTMPVSIASSQLAMHLIEFQGEYDLTDVEMFQAVTSWMQTHLKYMLREERHPDDPERGADEE